ncbi:MAG: TerD family protein [Oscillatoriales cyanobacterium RM2_1_1]|nr:TerD family protein [Oscillatoriales cyanobacterium SM2_3_0]NJO44270.1 TerD family protein [Oscillatoriales cyanobacterium RM2_1_1]
MAINLQKGQSIVLDKSEFDLSRLTMGLGWDVAKPKGGFTGLFGGSKDFDLDGYAVLLDTNGKVKDYKQDVIYYGHLKSQDGTVVHSGDNLTGQGSGDDEQIIIQLNAIADRYSQILLGVSIYDAQPRKQHFGMVENAFVRAVDASGKEIARYSLSGETSYTGKISMLMGEIYKENVQWKFKALGTPSEFDMNRVVGSLM